jgi:hypothetical protein
MFLLLLLSSAWRIELKRICGLLHAIPSMPIMECGAQEYNKFWDDHSKVFSLYSSRRMGSNRLGF